MSAPVPTVATMDSQPDIPQTGVQASFEDLGTPLRDVTFVVFDLETTGGAPGDSSITEVGAVKVRGGEWLGEFATLVNPGGPIPAFITVLTGITDAMVAPAPRIETVLPSFLEFARGCVLVAHNAPFDVGFLRTACTEQGYPWPGFTTVDTADLARRVLTRDEAPNRKLATLARLFRTGDEPCHRAPADARATVGVLHGLLERVGAFGVDALEELSSFAREPTPLQRRKRHLARGIPRGPGVYIFQDADERPLYVGKSSDLESRVRSYFTGSETRARVRDMLSLVERVVPVVCATNLEAEVRELRLLAAHKPPYNRRSRFPERAIWLKLTAETFPRLVIARKVAEDGANYLGPFGSSQMAEAARAALHEAVPLRQCTGRLNPGRGTACTLAEMGRCGAPCEARESAAEYAEHVRVAREAILGDVRPVTDAMRARIAALSRQLRYEDAAVQRDRLLAFLRVTARTQRLAGLTACPEVVAARPTFGGGWELAVIRRGRLAAADATSPDTDPMARLDSLVAGAETVRLAPGPTPCAIPAETERVLAWLESPGTRLLEVDGVWCSPAHGAESVHVRLEGDRGHRDPSEGVEATTSMRTLI